MRQCERCDTGELIVRKTFVVGDVKTQELRCSNRACGHTETFIALRYDGEESAYQLANKIKSGWIPEVKGRDDAATPRR